MWLFTRHGYFSICQKPGEKQLTIRARVRADLENLRVQYLPKIKIIERAGTDYQFRAKVSHKQFANAVKKMVLEIGYENFKEEVAGKQGMRRSMVYHRVWSVLTGLEREDGRGMGLQGEDSEGCFPDTWDGFESS